MTKPNSIFPFQRSEVVIGASIVFVVFIIGLISLGQPLPGFRDPCNDGFFRIAPIIAAISFLFTIYWATIGLIRFVGNQTFIFAGDLIPRSTHLAFLLPLLTILATVAGVAGFIAVGVISVILLVTSYLGSQISPPNNTLVVIGNIVLSFVTFGLSIFLMVIAVGMCLISSF